MWPKVEIAFYNHLEQGNRAEALRIVKEKDLPYLDACMSTKRYWACLKVLLEMIGLPGGPVRQPLLEVEPQDREMLVRVCTEIGLLEESLAI